MKVREGQVKVREGEERIEGLEDDLRYAMQVGTQLEEHVTTLSKIVDTQSQVNATHLATIRRLTVVNRRHLAWLSQAIEAVHLLSTRAYSAEEEEMVG